MNQQYSDCQNKRVSLFVKKAGHGEQSSDDERAFNNAAHSVKRENFRRHKRTEEEEKE